MQPHPTIALNDGIAMPQLGLGVFRIADSEVAPLVAAAIAAGYRAIDTAAAYGNEAGVGAGLRASGLARERLFVTTKVPNDHHGAERARAALEGSLDRLGLPFVDLCLIHWPLPSRDLFVETWRTLVALKAEGKTRSIGVSNFTEAHLERLIGETGVVPSVNQVELHPRFQQRALREFHARHDIATESWGPLGRGPLLSDPVLAAIAARHGRTPAQVVVRWHLQSGLLVIPKSAQAERVRANADVFGFALDAADMDAIATMDEPDGRTGRHPDAMT